MGAFGDILGSIVSNSHFGKRSGARDMAIFGSYVGLHILNIRYLVVYEGQVEEEYIPTYTLVDIHMPHILTYTSKYLHIPPYTSIYFHIPQNLQY